MPTCPVLSKIVIDERGVEKMDVRSEISVLLNDSFTNRSNNGGYRLCSARAVSYIYIILPANLKKNYERG